MGDFGSQLELLADADPELFQDMFGSMKHWGKQKQVEVVRAITPMVSLLREDLDHIYQLSPEEFEVLICDRLDRMDFAVTRIGSVYVPDGGVDIIACPKRPAPFPYLLAVQAKHRQEKRRRVGPGAVRDLKAVVAAHSFNAGVLVTNTTFTPDAVWVAQQLPTLVRLRDIEDLRRWIYDNFVSEHEWREIPESIVLRPNLVVKIRGE